MTARRKPRGGPSEKAAKTGKDERPQIREFGITPMEFYKKYVPVDVNDLVTFMQCADGESSVWQAVSYSFFRQCGGSG